MAVREIIKYGHPVLRMKAKPVEKIDDTINILVEDMIDTMIAAEGIGLAATQVAELVSVCIVNMGLIKEGTSPKAFINPEILKVEGSCVMEEGCLSIPDIREKVTRPEKIRVKYLDLGGVAHEEDCDGMLARVLQHEIDHLNGVLFIDRISPMKRKLLSKKLKKIAEGSKTQVATTSAGGL